MSIVRVFAYLGSELVYWLLITFGCPLHRSATHGQGFYHRGGEDFFFMCTWIRNGYRGGDVFGCHSLGEEGGKGGKENVKLKRE